MIDLLWVLRDLSDHPAVYAGLIAPQLLIPPSVILQQTNSDLKLWVQRNFTFNLARFWEEGRWWTAVSPMAFHHDYDHLRANLLGQILLQGLVRERLGNIGLYVTFIGGGIYSALVDHFEGGVFHLFHWRGDKLPQPQSNPLPRWFRGSNVTSWFSSKITGFFKDVTSGARNWFQRHLRFECGSSGGVFSLMGASFMSHMEYLLFTPNSLLTWQGLRTVVNVSFLGFAVLSEYDNVWEPKKTYDVNGREITVAHGVHLNGFVFGAVSYVIMRLVRKFVLPELKQRASNWASRSNFRGLRRG